jgi:hypothetical protein
MIEWYPYDSLNITPEMENTDLLLYVEQVKMCHRKVPEILTASIIDGKVEICYSHKPEELDFSLSKITHYTIPNYPQ